MVSSLLDTSPEYFSIFYGILFFIGKGSRCNKHFNLNLNGYLNTNVQTMIRKMLQYGQHGRKIKARNGKRRSTGGEGPVITSRQDPRNTRNKTNRIKGKGIGELIEIILTVAMSQ